MGLLNDSTVMYVTCLVHVYYYTCVAHALDIFSTCSLLNKCDTCIYTCLVMCIIRHVWYMHCTCLTKQYNTLCYMCGTMYKICVLNNHVIEG